MKKKNIDFEARFWASYSETCPLKVIDALFKTDTLSEIKDQLYEMMHFAMKPEVFLPNNPSVIFHFYTSLKSFLRAAYVLSVKAQHWKLNEPPNYVSHVMQGSLYDDEYNVPFFAFERAFENYTLQQYEDFLTEVTYFALAPYSDYPKGNIISPFLHLQKMLDAARLFKERKIET